MLTNIPPQFLQYEERIDTLLTDAAKFATMWWNSSFMTDEEYRKGVASTRELLSELSRILDIAGLADAYRAGAPLHPGEYDPGFNSDDLLQSLSRSNLETLTRARDRAIFDKQLRDVTRDLHQQIRNQTLSKTDASHTSKEERERNRATA